MATPVQTTSDSTPDAILKAATTLFARKGINGTTTREIADLAGVNIAALHYHWGGKDDLLQAVYQRVIDEVGLLAGSILNNRTSHFKEALKKHLGLFHDFFFKNPAYPRILLYGDLESPPFLEKLRETFITPIMQQVSATMKTLIREKKIRKVDPEASLISFYGFLLIQFADLACQKSCMGGTIADAKIAKRFKEQFIDTVLFTLGLSAIE